MKRGFYHPPRHGSDKPNGAGASNSLQILRADWLDVVSSDFPMCDDESYYYFMLLKTRTMRFVARCRPPGHRPKPTTARRANNIMTMKLAVYLPLVSLYSTIAAMPVNASEQQTWLALATNGSLQEESRWRYWFDGHARSRDDTDGLGVSIIRPGIGWQANDWLTLWGGYARVVARRDGPDVEEHRIWQQATYPVAVVMGGKLTGRLF